MRTNLKQVYTLLFLVGVFFIPFNSYEGISFLGEYRKDGAIVFFLCASLLFFIDSGFKNKIRLPVKNLFFQMVLLFIFWLFLTTFLNSTTVSENYMKQTTGVSRFFRQLISLLIALTICITSYNVFSNFSINKAFFILRRAFLYSFLFVSLYSIFEILVVVFDIQFLRGAFSLYDYFPFTETTYDINYNRISGVSYEPPFLAIFLITVAGWMFSYILTSKSKIKYLPTFLVFVLTFFSGSRTALIVVFLQFVVFIWIAFSVSKRFNKMIQKFLVLIFSVFIVIFLFNGKKITEILDAKLATLNFKKNLEKSISNRSRFGIQYTSLLIFTENPIVGVGFGQQGFHAKDKYPLWVTKNNYEFDLFYLNEKKKSFPPGFNMYTRLLAETGIIGLLIFLFFLFLALYQCQKLIKTKTDTNKVIPIVLLISFVGFSVNWLQFDSFRVYGFWICLSLLMQQIQQKLAKYE